MSVSILYIPTDPAILAAGRCGARPPVAVRGSGDRPGFWTTNPNAVRVGFECQGFTAALVLAWEGEAVPEGMDRLMRFLAAASVSTDEFGNRPLVARVNGGGGLTFGRWGPHPNIPRDHDRWVLRDVSGVEAWFNIPRTDRGPLDYPLALATICASRLGGRVEVLNA